MVTRLLKRSELPRSLPARWRCVEHGGRVVAEAHPRVAALVDRPVQLAVVGRRRREICAWRHGKCSSPLTHCVHGDPCPYCYSFRRALASQRLRGSLTHRPVSPHCMLQWTATAEGRFGCLRPSSVIITVPSLVTEGPAT